jgi:hypothetical protein
MQLIFNINTLHFKSYSITQHTVTNTSGNMVFTPNDVYEWKNKHLIHKETLPERSEHTLYNPVTKSYIISTTKPPKSFFTSYSKQNAQLKKLWSIPVAWGFTAKAILPDGTFFYMSEGCEKTIPEQQTGFGIKNIVNSVYTDREGNVWMCTENGLYCYFQLDIEEYQFGLGKPDNIWSVVADAQNNIWLGSYGAGLWVLSNKMQLKPINYAANLSNAEKASSMYMYMHGKAIGTDVYIPAVAGLLWLQNGKYKDISHSSVCLSVLPDKNPNKLVYSGFENPTQHRGLYKGWGDKKRFYSWPTGFPISICRDTRGQIRVGAFRGQGTFTGDTILTDTTPRPYRGVICMELDPHGRLWKGTDKGLYYEMPDGKEHRLAPTQIQGQVLSMSLYKNKYLVVGGSKSLFVLLLQKQINATQPQLVEVGYDGGFTGLESGQNGISVAPDGSVWLATALNVLRFNPDKIYRHHANTLPSIRVASIGFSSDNIGWKTLFFDSSTQFSIPSGNSFYRITYIANSLSSARQLRFRYRLRGFNDGWSESTILKDVNYTNLPYGTYTFEVQCSLDGVKWSTTCQSPKFKLVPPWYLLPILIVLEILTCIFLLTLLILMLVKRNQKRKMEHINRKKLENELQLNTLRSKVIPHFTKNVLSAIGHFAMTDKLRASHYIAVFSKFTQLTLSNADKNYNSLEEEINYLRTYLELEKMRFDARFDYKISIEQHVNTAILIPGMTLHTYCDNAIRHGLVNKKGSGFLSINITNHHNGVLIVVEDNGIGRERAQQLGTRGNGQGLLLIEQQLQFYNSQNSEAIYQTITDLKDENNMPSGTRVNLYIPMNYRFQ